MKNSFGRSIPISLLILVFAVPSLAQYREAKLFAITTWNAGCSGSARSLWDDMGLAWYNEITRKGFYFLGSWWFGHGPDAYLKDGAYINGNIADSWFTDSDVVWWGNDKHYVDEADACMVCLHGGENSGRWQGSVRVNESGPGNCRTWQGDMEFGDWDLEFLHLSSCHSLDDNQWFFEWTSSFDGLHQVDGFHGEMWIGSSFIDDYEDFADDAFDMSIADAWLDNMYRTNINGAYCQCPVAYAVGANIVDMWFRIVTERYNKVHSDPHNIGYVGCFYIDGCDPSGEDVCGDDAWSGGEEVRHELSYEYMDLVEKELPKWDKRVLEIPLRKINWIENLSIQRIANSVMDSIRYEQKKKEQYEESRDGKSVVKLDRVRGYIRYSRENRQFRYETSPKKPVDTKRAIEVAREVIRKLDIPQDEFGPITVDRVIGMGAVPKAKKLSDKFVKESFITVKRALNDIPIFNSEVRLAISNNGELARLLVRWPHFEMRKELRLKDRKHIIKEVVARIEELEEGRPIELTMQLAYISNEDDEQTTYVPGTVITVKDEESCVLFTVNIAE